MIYHYKVKYIFTKTSYCNVVHNVFVVDQVNNDLAEEIVSSEVDLVPVATGAAASVGSHKLKDSDPLVLHVLPSAVTAECEYYGAV